jgi:hypothetical protein
MNSEMETARAVAPEDIRPGEYVTALQEVCEMPSWLWGSENRDSQLVRFTHLPHGNSEPAHVVEVCLPFVLVKTARGKRRVIDVRKYRLARVPEAFGRRVFEEIEAQRQAEKEEKDKDEKKESEQTPA